MNRQPGKRSSAPCRLFRLAPLCLLLVASGVCWEPAAWAQEESPASPLRSRGLVQDPDLDESSGLCRGPGERLWSLNDSGHPAELFLLEADGKTAARYPISGARNIDWEALASWPPQQHNWLVIADVGDNQRRRETYQLYLVAQPTRPAAAKPAPLPARTLPFRYAGEPGQPPVSRNCEAVGVDPLTGDLWLVEKIELTRSTQQPPGVFRIPYQKAWFADAPAAATLPLQTAQRIGDFPVRNVTGMAFSPDGQWLVIRNYFYAHLYRRLPEKSWQQTLTESRPRAMALPLQRQGEAVCFTADSRALLLTSEVAGQPLWELALPAADPADAPEK